MEQEREFVAGPGVTNLRAIDPATREEIVVGANLLEVSDTNPQIHVGTANLPSFRRQAAKRFDGEAIARRPEIEAQEPEKTALEQQSETRTSGEPEQPSLL